MLLDSIPSSVLLLDSQLHIVSANQNFLQKARVQELQIIGQRLDAVFPAAIYQLMNLRLRVSDVFRNGTAIKGERMVYRAPGLPARTYYYSLIPFRWEHEIENVMLLMEDVTDMIRLSEEARRAERHLASVVESASDIVLSMDINGNIRTWNTAAARIAGYEEGAVRHRNLVELCAPQQHAGLAKILASVPHQERTSPVEVELFSRDGTRIPISWVFSAMRDEDGQVVGLVALGRDLTERRTFEAQLIQSEKLAALGVMAGGIAHEIRNPLAVVSCAAQLLLKKELSHSVQLECAEGIYRNVLRVASIIESLLRFARPADKAVMQSLDFVPIIREALVLAANHAKVAKVEVVAHYPASPVFIRGNAGLLQQLVMNFVLNAINAMPEQGGSIRLTLKKRNGEAVLQVIDTGCGIPGTDLPKVFDPFFTTMPVGKGTGLGLSICYAIVQQHEGKIDISSQQGRGTTLTVTIPLGHEEGQA
jgi:PAS domain S-box-containing protein